MNDAPVPPFQPNPTPTDNPVPQPAPQVAPQQLSPQGSQALATWSMVLGIVGLALAVIFFVSIPAAIVAIILGIIVLAKHHPGKGKALAGIITGGVALLILPVILIFSVAVYNGISDQANKLKDASSQYSSKNSSSTSDEGIVDTPCFSYVIPAGYEASGTAKGCTTAINIPDGDVLTRITVKGNTGTIGSLQDVVATLNASLKRGDPNTEGIIDQEQLGSEDRPVYYVSYKDANGLLFGNYIIPDSSASQKDENGKTITAYTVAGYTYNSSLKGIVSDVFYSLDIK